MAVGLRGFVQMTSQADGVTVGWPGGTVAGDLAVVVANDSAGPGAGWTRWPQEVWSKTLTAADVAAGQLVIPGRLTGVQVFSAARGIGQVRERSGVAGLTLAEANSGIFVHGWTSNWRTTINPATGRLGAVVVHNAGRNVEAVWWKAAVAAGYTELSGPSADVTYVAYEILPTKAPGAPTVVPPAAYVPSDEPVVVSWVPDGRQDGYRVRFVNQATSAQHYLQANGTTTGTLTNVTSAATTVSVVAGQLVPGTYSVQVTTANEAGYGTVSSTGHLFTVAPRPTVNNITVSAPAGELNPTVGFTGTPGTGVLDAVQVRITTAGGADFNTPVWDSGIRSFASVTVDSLDADGRLLWVNGVNRRAWVRVHDSALWSAWTADDVTFQVTWTTPTAPSEVAVVDGTPITGTVTVPAGTERLEVQSTTDVGLSWLPALDVYGPAPVVVVPLPRTAWGDTVGIRARAWKTVDNILVPSIWVESGSEESTDRGGYLVSRDSQGDYLPVRLAEDGSRAVAEGISSSYPIGGRNIVDSPRFALVVRGPDAGEYGTTSIVTHTLDERQAVVDWLAAHDVFWLRWPPERFHGVPAGVPSTLMARTSHRKWERPWQTLTSARVVSFDWVEQG